MSHFTVLVIGEDPEGQLAPYHEFECTGENDQYIQDVDITAKVQEKISERGLIEGLKYYGLVERIVASEDEVDRSAAHKYGYVVVQDDKLVKAVDRTNPNKKWDWYQLGGRWTGYFKIKNGFDGEVGKPGIMTDPAKKGYADQLRKGAIDVEGMRNEAEQEARERYRQFHSVVKGLPQPQVWQSIVDKHGKDYDAARAEYGAQPAIVALRKSKEFTFEDRPERFYVTEDEFAQKARNRALISFAIVKDGKWYERGEMGWFGAVFDEKDPDAWEKEASALIDSVSDGTLLSLYDCHI